MLPRFSLPRAGMAKLANARDLKSCARKGFRVRSPVPASPRVDDDRTARDQLVTRRSVARDRAGMSERNLFRLLGLLLGLRRLGFLALRRPDHAVARAIAALEIRRLGIAL